LLEEGDHEEIHETLTKHLQEKVDGFSKLLEKSSNLLSYDERAK
jgi:hypothetical protein